MHTHSLIDTDTHFKIDGTTRLVKNVAETKTMLVQYDHKSEKFTFEVDRTPDDHDLSECNRVRVHFINIDKSKRTENKGVCDITDSLGTSADSEDLVTCSWAVPREATLLVGSLHFVIEFACIEGDEILYSWNTARHTAVTIAEGIDGGEEIVSANIDILTQWENELKANQITKIEQTTESTEDNGENVWTATFGDGRTQELTVRNGSKGDKGDTGLIGSIETIQGNQLHFFVGTKAEYEGLTEAEKTNLFAIITDDSTLYDEIQELLAWKEQIANAGGTSVTSAIYAERADCVRGSSKFFRCNTVIENKLITSMEVNLDKDCIYLVEHLGGSAQLFVKDSGITIARMNVCFGSADNLSITTLYACYNHTTKQFWYIDENASKRVYSATYGVPIFAKIADLNVRLSAFRELAKEG